MAPAILSFKTDHDGAIAGVAEKRLLFSIESEKNSVARFSWIKPETVTAAFRTMSLLPEVVCLSGWPDGSAYSSGYDGVDRSSIVIRDGLFFGRECKYFSSSHERSHLIGTFGLSSLPLGTPCYALLWEGGFGGFYELDKKLNIKRLPQVLSEPGERYAFLYHLARKTEEPFSHGGDAGKLMALAAYSDRGAPNESEQEFISQLFGEYYRYSFPKSKLAHSPYYSIGEEHESVKQLAGKFSDAIFDHFYRHAKRQLTKKLPLLISGGCGLNCEWNTRWLESGLFEDVFVTPVANDTGSALGTAIDAQFILTGDPKVEWTVYSGEHFDNDVEVDPSLFVPLPFSYSQCAELLESGKVLAWVQGRYEMGPRALGNRSLLAAPFTRVTHNRLNGIKQREQYRPIAPVCLEEDLSIHFAAPRPSPHMLFFHQVKNEALQAVTHVDNSARPQSVSRAQNPELYELLCAFKHRTGVGVLCNTSLNFNGRGFINEMSDLVKFCHERMVDGFVVGERLFVRRTSAT